ncbi:MAG: hypothetical protein HS111_16275 [Kofleriaceae bacterium]|nr:hypothetical protein [Kofleriaceae bacterium]MCL4227627.1 hypothetical protein [Myxococcales bacterium]
MRHLAPLVLLSLVPLAVACGPRAAPPPSQGPAGKMELRMQNCPSAVPGAATDMRPIDGGVVLDVTAADPQAARRIVELAQRHAAMGAPDPDAGLHTGGHGGPGDRGHCPVIHVDTTVTAVEIAGGARITILANDPEAAPELVRQTRARIDYLDPAARAP